MKSCDHTVKILGIIPWEDETLRIAWNTSVYTSIGRLARNLQHLIATYFVWIIKSVFFFFLPLQSKRPFLYFQTTLNVGISKWKLVNSKELQTVGKSEHFTLRLFQARLHRTADGSFFAVGRYLDESSWWMKPAVYCKFRIFEVRFHCPLNKSNSLPFAKTMTMISATNTSQNNCNPPQLLVMVWY